MASGWSSSEIRPSNALAMLRVAMPKRVAAVISKMRDSFVMVPSIIVSGEAFRNCSCGTLGMRADIRVAGVWELQVWAWKSRQQCTGNVAVYCRHLRGMTWWHIRRLEAEVLLGSPGPGPGEFPGLFRSGHSEGSIRNGILPERAGVRQNVLRACLPSIPISGSAKQCPV